MPVPKPLFVERSELQIFEPVISTTAIGATAANAHFVRLGDLTTSIMLQQRINVCFGETRFIIGETQATIDTTLVANIAKARDWFRRIKTGESYAEIARADDTSKRHVQRMIDFAFLAPDIVRDVCEGNQPLGLTTEWLKNHPLPSDWTAQRAIISTL